jgi:hypothetical protein
LVAVLIVVALLLVAGGAIVVAFFDPSPPIKHFEVPVSNDRFAH